MLLPLLIKNIIILSWLNQCNINSVKFEAEYNATVLTLFRKMFPLRLE